MSRSTWLVTAVLVQREIAANSAVQVNSISLDMTVGIKLQQIEETL
jgi:hypothetical protein